MRRRRSFDVLRPQTPEKRAPSAVALAPLPENGTIGRFYQSGPVVPLAVLVQRKLVIGEAHGQAEREASEVAKAASANEEGAASTPGAAGPLPSAGPAHVLRPPDSGQPLSPRVRARIEPLLGADLSHVRVHTGAAARGMAKTLRAKAFTHGSHIWLGPDQSPESVELMAHEATHVLQQQGAEAAPIQRAPADYRHPEDGEGVQSRMNARIAEEVEDMPENPDPAEARRKMREADRTEVRRESRELQPLARPTVDRPATERPKVRESAAITGQEVRAPAEPLGEKRAAAGPEQKDGKTPPEPLSAEAARAMELFGAASVEPEPPPEPKVTPPGPVFPVDAGGAPLEFDPAPELEIASLAQQAQTLREGGLHLRQLAAQERANAGIMRGNFSLIEDRLTQSEEGVVKSQEHLTARQGVLAQGRVVLAQSVERTATVAEQAPGFQQNAERGKEESSPVAEESRDLVSENDAQAPDDEEAAENSREQGGKMREAGSGAATIDSTISTTTDRSRDLQRDAARASQTNTRIGTGMDQMQETLQKTGERVTQMGAQNVAARGRVAALRPRTDLMTAAANDLDQRGYGLLAASQEMESRLGQTQREFASGMRAVPKVEPLEGEGPGAAPEAASAERPEAPTPEAEAPTGEAEAPAGPPPAAESGEEALVQRQPEEVGYSGRVNVDIGGAMPGWAQSLTGVERPSDEARARQEQQNRERRSRRLAELNEMSGGNFDNLSTADKLGFALRATGSDLLGSAGEINWPDLGKKLVQGLIDPRVALSGVISGLSMTVSGIANLFSAEQWRRDPLGNLLTSAADIAMGLTVILGSITALAAVVAGLCTAVIIFSFGLAAPVLGPVVAFCGSVMTIVGGWTIAVGKVALILRLLVFIKNLIEAAVASNADKLINAQERMTQDAKSAGTVLLQIAGAKLGQIGGRGLRNSITAAGGGVRFAARLGALGPRGAARAIAGGAGRLVRAAPGAVGRGLRAVPGLAVRGLRALPRAAGRVFTGTARVVLALPRGALLLMRILAKSGIRGAFAAGRRGLEQWWANLRQQFRLDYLVGEGLHGGGVRATLARSAAETSRIRAAAARLAPYLANPGLFKGLTGEQAQQVADDMSTLGIRGGQLEPAAEGETPPASAGATAAGTPPPSPLAVRAGALQQRLLQVRNKIGQLPEEAPQRSALASQADSLGDDLGRLERQAAEPSEGAAAQALATQADRLEAQLLRLELYSEVPELASGAASLRRRIEETGWIQNDPRRAEWLRQLETAERRIQELEQAIQGGAADTAQLRAEAESLRRSVANLQLATRSVPIATPQELARVREYLEAVRQLREALAANNNAVANAARQQLGEIEELALANQGVAGPYDHLWEHIQTLVQQKEQLLLQGENAVVPGFGEMFQANSQAIVIEGRSAVDIARQIGRLPDRRLPAQASGQVERVRVIWDLEDGSQIILDYPNTPETPFEHNQLPHASRTAAAPNQDVIITREGIGVPDRSTPAHTPVRGDSYLENWRFKDKSHWKPLPGGGGE